MIKLFILKHGLTCSNGIGKRVLSVIGRQQARTLILPLWKQNLTAIYSSPALRTEEMVLPLSMSLNIPIQIDDRLRDFRLSNYTLKDYYSTVQRSFKAPHLHYPGCESIIHVRKRLLRFIKEKSLTQSKSNILISTHGVCAAVLINQYTGQSISDLWINIHPGDIYELIINCYDDKKYRFKVNLFFRKNNRKKYR